MELQGWFELFPEYKENDFFLTGAITSPDDFSMLLLGAFSVWLIVRWNECLASGESYAGLVSTEAIPPQCGFDGSERDACACGCSSCQT